MAILGIMVGSDESYVKEYLHADHARTFRSTAGSQTQVDVAQIDELERELLHEGYVIVEGLVDAQTLAAIRADVVPRFEYAGGRTRVEGFKTRRLYAVPDKTFVCNPLVEHPLVLALLDRVLRPNYLLSQLQVIEIAPGEEAQPLHYDAAFYPFARPRPPLAAATVFAIDGFTADNGATQLIPRSHQWDDARAPGPEDRAIPAVMPAGSMVLFLGSLWHGGGANRSAEPRLAVTAQYCQPYLRTQENYSLGLSRERAAACSEHMQRLLGYSIHPPFMGMVDGKHPKRTLEASLSP